MIEDMKEYKRLYNINFQRWKNGCLKAFSFVELPYRLLPNE